MFVLHRMFNISDVLKDSHIKREKIKEAKHALLIRKTILVETGLAVYLPSG